MIRSLVQLIPFGVGSAVDTGIAVRLSNIREERLRSFFDELAEGDVDLPEELLESDDFIHCVRGDRQGCPIVQARGESTVFR